MLKIIKKMDEIIELLHESKEYEKLLLATMEIKKDKYIFGKINLYENLKKEIQINETNILIKTQLLKKLNSNYKKYLKMQNVNQYLIAKEKYNTLEYRVYRYIQNSLKKEIEQMHII